MVDGLTIRREGDDAVDRVEKRSTSLELLAKSGSAEVYRQSIEAGRHFYLYASDEWAGFELIYVLCGVLTIDKDPDGDEEQAPVVLNPGDCIHHNGLPKRVYFRVNEAAELLLFSSAPGFDLATAGVADMVAMARSVEEKDEATQGHCDRLGHWAIKTGEKLELDGQQLIDLSYGAFLHDIGKVKVPSDILTKEASLTDKEWKEMSKHPDYGADMMSERDYLGGAASIVRAHHERFDGGGYPCGLKGEEIPIGARVVAVVDTYDAIVSARPYKKALAKEEAISELKKNAGTQFDPTVVRAFLEVIKSTSDEKADIHAE
ncbi:HD-GYP domain-containing protein [Candidatus Bipolaricaulota bacterium]|nr:HD-GYP domain-containing protein [Candidatus Bipolaricaulota bacterium]